MITIKKVIWISASVLVVIMLLLSYSTIKKHFAMKKIKEIQTEKKAENMEEPSTEGNEDNEEVEENEEEKEEETVSADNSLKDYLTDKFNKAMKRIFKNDIKITAIGDSLTQGVGDEEDNGGYVGILEDTINKDNDLVEIDNFGKRGNRTDQLIDRMEEPEIKESLEEADIILITIGANDIMQIFKENFTDLDMNQFETGQNNYENRLHEIFSDLESMNSRADIYLVGFYNPFSEHFPDIEELEVIIENWNELGEDITDEYDQVSYIPTNSLFEDTSTKFLSDDNFHPNHMGYERMAKQVLEYIVNEGEPDEEKT